jgi:hypothetical protein
MWKRKSLDPLPYGVWTCADGTEVLFSRAYCPMYVRRPGQPAVPDVKRWVHGIRATEYFFDDASYRRMKKLLPQILANFIAGKEVI